MTVGVCTITLHLPFSHSLKDKRKVIKSLKDRLRSRHNVSFAEVDAQDTWQRSVLAVAAVASARQPLEAMFESILGEVAGHIPGEITEHEIEYL